VFEDGRLHIYRDVYDQHTNTEDALRTVLTANGSSFDSLSEEVKLEAAEDLYIRSVHNFNQAVKGNGKPSATGEDGLKSLAVGLAVLESTKTGRQVKVRHQ